MHLVGPFRRLLWFVGLDTREVPHDRALLVENVYRYGGVRLRRQVVVDEHARRRVLAHRWPGIHLIWIVQVVRGFRRVEEYA